MARITIDEREYEVREGQNLLHAALSLGLDIPYFCWHPAIGSVGACRQCAVKQFRDDNDTRGKLVMACMTPALDGVRISIDDQDAREFRESVIEWLMINHPHDCPICDEGGECHLQDMTVMTGHAYRRYGGKKRTFRNQELGPLVNHEMNRCIQCYRCVRFYRDYAGGRDFDVFGIHSQVYFGRQKDGVLESEFSGNLVEICPTGVFTDKTLKQHYSRKWDLQTAPSICVHCGLGCNTIPGERYGMLRRIYNRYNSEVNGYFLCDRGRFGYEFVNGSGRLRRALVRRARDGEATALGSEEALNLAAAAVSNSGVIGIGSPRASLEANFALRTLVGADNFYAGLSERQHRLSTLALDITRNGPCRPPSLSEVARADAVLVLGEDVTQTAPMLALALRRSVRRAPLKKAAGLSIPEWDAAGVRNAVQQEKGPLYVISPAGTKLDEVATQTCHASPREIARLGFAIAHALDVKAPPVTVLFDHVRALVTKIVAALEAADQPLIVSGGGCGSEEVLRAAANIARALRHKGRPACLSLTTPECNSMGVALMGGGSLTAAFEAVKSGQAKTVVVLENDLYRRAEAKSVDALLAAAEHVIVIDHTGNATTAKADVVLSAGTFAESDGTLVNNEGRAQRFYKVMTPDGEVRESWRWLRDLMLATGRSEIAEWTNIDDVQSALAAALPVFQPIGEVAPPADFRMTGLRIARQPTRYSGRTAMSADVNLHEPQPPEDLDSPLSFSMEGYQGQPPSPLVPRFWASGWNSVQALNKYQEEIGGPLRGGDPGKRLIEQDENGEAPYLPGVPREGERPMGYYLLVPAHHIFGSEELSVLAPGIAQLAPQPYVGLSPDDARGSSLEEGQEVEITCGEWSRRLPVKIIGTLPGGTLALPVGLAGFGWLDLPALGELRNSREDAR